MSRSNNHTPGLTRWVFMLALAASLVSLMLYRGRMADNPQLRAQMIAQDTVSPVVAILSVPLKYIQGGFEGIADRARAHEENVALRDELRTLRANQSQGEVARLKLTRLESLLNLSTDDTQTEPITARAVSESEGPFVRSLLINAGRKDGVKIGQAVMSPEGLSGHVINTGRSSARVLKLTDLNSRIPVMSLRNGGSAILAGDNSAMPRLAFVQDQSLWEAGDKVVTSGDDGRLPRGLSIGEVVISETGDLQVRVAAFSRSIDWVRVLPFAPIPAPVEESVAAPNVSGGAP